MPIIYDAPGTFHFTGAVAYDRLGSSWRTAAGLRSVSVIDGTTGLLPMNLVQDGVAVTSLTADANSRYSFTCDVPGVAVDFGAGVQMLYANEVPMLAITEAQTVQAIADDAAASAAAAAESASLVGAPADTAVAAIVGNPASATRVSLDATFVTTSAMTSAVAAGRPIQAWAYGVRTGTGTDQKTALYAAFAAAEATAMGTVVELPPGVITIAGSLSLSGYSCGLVGHGASTVSAGSNVPAGTVLQAVSQSGPVLDFAGWRGPNNYIGRVVFGGFTVAGDGVVNPANKGIYMGGSSNNGSAIIGVSMRDVTITNTGGIGFDAARVYLSDFDAITVISPIAPKVNNTSYIRLTGCNGSRFRGFGLRSMLASGDVPALGALRCVAEGINAFHDALIDGMWLENLHVGSNNAIIIMQTNKCVISDLQIFDCEKEVGATGTSCVRFEPSTVLDSGGNIMRGIIPGKDTTGTGFDVGVEVRQYANRIEGVKGYRESNVLLAAGVNYTWVELGGAESPANAAGIIDNSGTTTNTMIDGPQGQWTIAGRAGQGFFKANGTVLA